MTRSKRKEVESVSKNETGKNSGGKCGMKRSSRSRSADLNDSNSSNRESETETFSNSPPSKQTKKNPPKRGAKVAKIIAFDEIDGVARNNNATIAKGGKDKKSEAQHDDNVVDENDHNFDGVDVYADPTQSDFDSELEGSNNELDLDENEGTKQKTLPDKSPIVSSNKASPRPCTSGYSAVFQDAGFRTYFNQMMDEKLAKAKVE